MPGASKIDYLSDVKGRKVLVSAFAAKVKPLHPTGLITAQDTDVAVGSPVALDLGLPFYCLDKQDGKLTEVSSLFGKDLTLLIDHIENFAVISDVVTQAKANGADVRCAVAREKPSPADLVNLKGLGIRQVIQI